jgi:two-component system OmpR family sensor kinase
MVSIFQRGLFWRVYVTLLASLVLVAVLGSVLQRQLAEQAAAGPTNVPSATLGALLPGKDAPRPAIEAAVQRLSAALEAKVSLSDPGGRPLATAQDGRMLTPQILSGPGWAGQDRPAAKSRVWRVHLADGRGLMIQRPAGFRAAGPHPLGMLMAIAAAVGLAAFPIVSRLTRRLETLRSSLDAWGEGRLDRRAPVEGRDEIAAVAASFNAAADRVETLLDAHKALLAHASHELRSPLTRLRVAVDMFASAPSPDLRPAIIADIAELDGLVDEILLASQLDHALGPPEREIVDCLGLAVEEAARAGASVRHAGGDSSSFEVEGSLRLLRRLIRNLLENACKHGRSPVEIELSRAGAAAGGWVAIAVHDHGPGIPEAEHERVFEPFYRPSGRTEAAGSWGLGLSIVRQIAQRHGGSVSYQSRPDGAGGFMAVLPARRIDSGPSGAA